MDLRLRSLYRAMCSQPENNASKDPISINCINSFLNRASYVDYLAQTSRLRIPLNDRKSGRTCRRCTYRFLAPNQASHSETNVRIKYMILANPKIVVRHHRNSSDAHEITDSNTRDTLVD